MKNLKQSIYKELYISVIIIFFILALFGSLFGIYGITSGYMIFDYGHNLHHIELSTGIEAYDMLTNGEIVTPNELLIMGFSRLKNGLIVLCISLFYIGYAMMHFEILLRSVHR